MRNTLLLVGLLAMAIAAAPSSAQPAASDRTLVYTPIAPCRLLDTRDGFSPLTPGSLWTVWVNPCVDPSLATAVAVNFVAVGPHGPGHLTAWPFTQPKPATSVINFHPGVTIANGLILEVQDGAFSVEAGVSATHLVVDMVGYFAPQPRRLLAQFVRHGAGGIESFLCVNNSQNVEFGLSHLLVDWLDAELACPVGTWVCSSLERGSAACNTSRPDGTCDHIDQAGNCFNAALDLHLGWTGTTNGSTLNAVAVDEMGTAGSARFDSRLPVWCCSPF